jgi:exosortase J
MSAFPDREIYVPVVRRRIFSPFQFAALATVLTALGLFAIWPAVRALWLMWTTDALKSIGMIVPPVSLILLLRAWRRLGWEAEGTWWGLILVLLTTVVAVMQERAVLILVVSPQWSTPLPPPSLVLFAYGSGAVLFFGGKRLYKAALFPILLLLFANPIPHAFSLLVDLPLQRISAEIARAFAMHLGQPLTPDHLRLMFTPDFGMFIAPGCNGIRGSITMGFIALIAGYLYRFRWYANLSVVVGAVLLGYMFNLFRLCLLVLYYLVALHFPSLQNKAENADYVIGALLFLLATFFLFNVIHRLRDAENGKGSEPAVDRRPATVRDFAPRVQMARIAAMAGVVVFSCVGFASSRAATYSTMTPSDTAQRFSEHIGNYTWARTWNETLPTGSVVYVWAQYVPVGGGTSMAIGISPLQDWHDPLICHTIRGEHPLWEGPLTVRTADVVPVNFNSAFYNDGVTQSLEAFTQCTSASCDEFATERSHFGFVYTHLDPRSLLSKNMARSVPIMIRAETLDMTLPAGVARQRLTDEMRSFLASVRLEDLTSPAPIDHQSAADHR